MGIGFVRGSSRGQSLARLVFGPCVWAMCLAMCLGGGLLVCYCLAGA